MGNLKLKETPENEALIEHCKQSSREVQSWPRWKSNLPGEPTPLNISMENACPKECKRYLFVRWDERAKTFLPGQLEVGWTYELHVSKRKIDIPFATIEPGENKYERLKVFVHKMRERLKELGKPSDFEIDFRLM